MAFQIIHKHIGLLIHCSRVQEDNWSLNHFLPPLGLSRYFLCSQRLPEKYTSIYFSAPCKKEAARHSGKNCGPGVRRPSFSPHFPLTCYHMKPLPNHLMP